MLTKIIITTISFLILDGLWLGVIAKEFYRKNLASFPNLFDNMIYAIPAYILLIVGVVVFILPKVGDMLLMLRYMALF